MAFAQQQIRPRQRSQPSFTSTDEALLSPSSPTHTNRILSTGQPHVISPPSTSSTSDSETDWHVISSALRSTTSTSSSGSDSYSLPPNSLDRRDSLSIESSEIESYSSFRPSDTESFSDLDFAFDVLPSHDGTGTFIEDDPTTTSEEEVSELSSQQQTSLVLRTRRGDFEPTSPSMPNILLPYGGIHLPSFATTQQQQQQQQQHSLYHHSTIESPTFQPTVIAKDLTLSSDDSRQQHDKDDYNSATTNSSDDHIEFTRKRQRNLDSIPTHHPSFPGSITSFAILSAIWNNLRRLTNHLIENDTYTADAFTTLVSEATLEGCLPFGSHLHMELAAGIRPAYTTRGYDGLPGM